MNMQRMKAPARLALLEAQLFPCVSSVQAYAEKYSLQCFTHAAAYVRREYSCICVIGKKNWVMFTTESNFKLACVICVFTLFSPLCLNVNSASAEFKIPPFPSSHLPSPSSRFHLAIVAARPPIFPHSSSAASSPKNPDLQIVDELIPSTPPPPLNLEWPSSKKQSLKLRIFHQHLHCGVMCKANVMFYSAEYGFIRSCAEESQGRALCVCSRHPLIFCSTENPLTKISPAAQFDLKNLMKLG